MRARLRWYHAHLGRVLPYFRGQIQPVNGARDVATVYAEMELLLAGPAPRPEETPVGPRGPVTDDLRRLRVYPRGGAPRKLVFAT